MSSKGIEPFAAINQFFYREPPLPIGSPALSYIILKTHGFEPRTFPLKVGHSTNRVLLPLLLMS